jgi:hypothetical protein
MTTEAGGVIFTPLAVAFCRIPLFESQTFSERFPSAARQQCRLTPEPESEKICGIA